GMIFARVSLGAGVDVVVESAGWIVRQRPERVHDRERVWIEARRIQARCAEHALRSRMSLVQNVDGRGVELQTAGRKRRAGAEVAAAHGVRNHRSPGNHARVAAPKFDIDEEKRLGLIAVVVMRDEYRAADAAAEDVLLQCRPLRGKEVTRVESVVAKEIVRRAVELLR